MSDSKAVKGVRQVGDRDFVSIKKYDVPFDKYRIAPH
jgi:hypothetical protein